MFPSVTTSPVLLLIAMRMWAAASSPYETCFSREHQSVCVNMSHALNSSTTFMNPRVTQSEKDCVLACCSEDIRPGIKCTLAVFYSHKSPEPLNNQNCHLFYCQNEQDCPLQPAELGTNTYDIFKGLIHPTMRPPPSTVQPTSTTTTQAPTPTSTFPTTTTTTTTTPSPPPPTPAPHRDPEATRRTEEPPTVSTSAAPLTFRTTPATALVPKRIQSGLISPGTEGHGGRKEAGHGALKSSLVAVGVVGLAILTLALAVMGRKAMESFDRRHYTRLELNDLHYEV
ncbi:hypothetical protein UPYG_G00274150 [Umbra pygmaea]|uniref:MANSC domain-containing protein n=1 Tax=Umbra pygmaea TaxID=75934 RepID=A0ABD0WHF5_UMBPY